MRRSRSLDRRCLPSRSRSVPSYRNRAHMAKNASPTRNGVSHSQEFKRQKKLASASVSEKRRRSYDRSLSSREKSVSKHRVTHSHRHSRPVSLSSSDDVKNRNYEKNRRTVPSGTRDKRTQFLSSVSLSPSTHYMRRKERRSSRSNSGFKRPTNISFRRSRSVKDRSSSLRRGNVGARRRPAMSSYIGTREPRRTLNSFVRSRYPQPALNRIDDRRFTNTTRVVPRPVTSHTTSSMRPSRRPALPYSGRSPIRRPIVSDQQNFSRSFHPRDHHRSLGHTNGRSFSTVQDNFTGLQGSLNFYRNNLQHIKTIYGFFLCLS